MKRAEPTSIPSEVEAYIGVMDPILGWFFIHDALVFAAVAAQQTAVGITGDLLEIGVLRGKSAIVLGYLAQDGEKLVVCDVFEEDADLDDETAAEKQEHYPVVNRHEFERQYLRFHAELPEIIAAPSTELNREDLLHTFRLAHVDGGHSYEVVREDIATVRQLLVPGGVAIFDDWANYTSPGVAVAVWEEFAKGEMVPICLTNNKLYAKWDPAGVTAEELDAWASADPRLDVSHPHQLGNHAVRRYSPRPPGVKEPTLTKPLPSPEEAPKPEPQVTIEALPAGATGLKRTIREAARQIAPPIALTGYRRLRGQGRGGA